VPNVAVVIPVRDRAAMVVEAIVSVCAQTYRDLGIVVVDDGSRDGSAAAAEAALADAAVPVCILRQPGRGVAAARNAGAAVLDARWLAFLDSDDLWLPQKLARQMAWLEARPTYRVAQTGERWIDAGRHRNPRAWHRKDERIFVRSLARCLVSPSAVVLTRAFFESTGGFDEAFSVCEDYELWLRVTAREAVGFVPEALVVKRGGHVGQLSRSTWGLDRWRVAALAKLLATVPLDDDARAAVVAVAVAKCAVLATGAERRGRCDEAVRYRQLAAAIAVEAASSAPAPMASTDEVATVDEVVP
jgi:glycosyltransferase involved in cell wall biosynthesis